MIGKSRIILKMKKLHLLGDEKYAGTPEALHAFFKKCEIEQCVVEFPDDATGEANAETLMTIGSIFANQSEKLTFKGIKHLKINVRDALTLLEHYELQVQILRLQLFEPIKDVTFSLKLENLFKQWKIAECCVEFPSNADLEFNSKVFTLLSKIIKDGYDGELTPAGIDELKLTVSAAIELSQRLKKMKVKVKKLHLTQDKTCKVCSNQMENLFTEWKIIECDVVFLKNADGDANAQMLAILTDAVTCRYLEKVKIGEVNNLRMNMNQISKMTEEPTKLKIQRLCLIVDAIHKDISVLLQRISKRWCVTECVIEFPNNADSQMEAKTLISYAKVVADIHFGKFELEIAQLDLTISKASILLKDISGHLRIKHLNLIGDRKCEEHSILLQHFFKTATVDKCVVSFPYQPDGEFTYETLVTLDEVRKDGYHGEMSITKINNLNFRFSQAEIISEIWPGLKIKNLTVRGEQVRAQYFINLCIFLKNAEVENCVLEFPRYDETCYYNIPVQSLGNKGDKLSEVIDEIDHSGYSGPIEIVIDELNLFASQANKMTKTIIKEKSGRKLKIKSCHLCGDVACNGLFFENSIISECTLNFPAHARGEGNAKALLSVLNNDRRFRTLQIGQIAEIDLTVSEAIMIYEKNYFLQISTLRLSGERKYIDYPITLRCFFDRSKITQCQVKLLTNSAEANGKTLLVLSNSFEYGAACKLQELDDIDKLSLPVSKASRLTGCLFQLKITSLILVEDEPGELLHFDIRRFCRFVDVRHFILQFHQYSKGDITGQALKKIHDRHGKGQTLEASVTELELTATELGTLTTGLHRMTIGTLHLFQNNRSIHPFPVNYTTKELIVEFTRDVDARDIARFLNAIGKGTSLTAKVETIKTDVDGVRGLIRIKNCKWEIGKIILLKDSDTPWYPRQPSLFSFSGVGEWVISVTPDSTINTKVVLTLIDTLERNKLNLTLTITEIKKLRLTTDQAERVRQYWNQLKFQRIKKLQLIKSDILGLLGKKKRRELCDFFRERDDVITSVEEVV